MAERKNYNTRQMRQLREYLAETGGKHVTVNEICDYFNSRGIEVGMTTVYRNLEKLAGAGEVAKYSVSGSGSCFEYLGEHSECRASHCHHLKCEKCGKLIHLSCGELDELSDHLFNDHGFVLNEMSTVLYGTCAACLGE